MAGANVLITSAAAKLPLVRAFRDAAHERGAKVLAADIDPACPAAREADGFLLAKRTDEPGAFEQLVYDCAAHDIGLIVPTRDGEIPFFARQRPDFEARGVRVLAPSPESVRVCQDKRAFTKLLEKYGYPYIPILDPRTQNPSLPLFARPATGASGKGARRIDAGTDLATLADTDLLHPFIEAPEISIDLLMDLDGGRPVQAVARERVLVVGGESKVTRVIDAPHAIALAMRLGQALGLVGHNLMQAFLHPDLGVLPIEINPRFGGASALSIAAGLDSPRRLLQMLAGEAEAFAPRPIQTGAALYRTDRDLIVPGAISGAVEAS